MRQLTDRMTVGELQLEMELQSLRVRVAELEAAVAALGAAQGCTCAHGGPERAES
jgi:hypothetical protein